MIKRFIITAFDLVLTAIVATALWSVCAVFAVVRLFRKGVRS